MSPDFAKMDGLIPVVAQDARTGRILTLAFQDETAWERTLETGQVHYWSRSRDELWRKGETSGNMQRVDGVSLDCDQDSAVLLVTPDGPACHTGQATCFHDPVQGADDPVLLALERTVADRDETRPEGSYTAELLDDRERLRAKIEEEAGELADAVEREPGDRVAEEAADLLYHVLVGLRDRDVPLEAVLEVLRGRMR